MLLILEHCYLKYCRSKKISVYNIRDSLNDILISIRYYSISEKERLSIINQIILFLGNKSFTLKDGKVTIRDTVPLAKFLRTNKSMKFPSAIDIEYYFDNLSPQEYNSFLIIRRICYIKNNTMYVSSLYSIKDETLFKDYIKNHRKEISCFRRIYTLQNVYDEYFSSYEYNVFLQILERGNLFFWYDNMQLPTNFALAQNYVTGNKTSKIILTERGLNYVKEVFSKFAQSQSKQDEELLI